MTVYVTKEPRNDRYDLSSAQKYGEFVYVFDKYYNEAQCPLTTMNHAFKMLRNFDYKKDFLLEKPGETPIAARCCNSVLRYLGYHEIVHLEWNREIGEDGRRLYNRGSYKPVTWVIDQGVVIGQ